MNVFYLLLFLMVRFSLHLLMERIFRFLLSFSLLCDSDVKDIYQFSNLLIATIPQQVCLLVSVLIFDLFLISEETFTLDVLPVCFATSPGGPVLSLLFYIAHFAYSSLAPIVSIHSHSIISSLIFRLCIFFSFINQ